jgi:hypothetical protein
MRILWLGCCYVFPQRRQEAYVAAQQMKLSAPTYQWNGATWEVAQASPPLQPPKAHPHPPLQPPPQLSAAAAPLRPLRKIEALRLESAHSRCILRQQGWWLQPRFVIAFALRS